MAQRKSFQLNNGTSIPSVGFGTWKSKPEDAYNSVKVALEAGYRHIDTAFIYGNEPDVGKALKDSGIPRSEIFLTTKLWSTYHTRVEENLNLSLEQLGVEYLDLYLMHWPVAMNPHGEPPKFPLLPDGTRDVQHSRHFADTWEDMEKVLESGKVKAIGVSNFDVHNLEVLREKCTVTPAVNQVELHPYMQQKKLKAYCESRGIHLTAYSPLGSTGSTVKEEPCFLEFGKKYSCDPCASILSWGVQAGHSVIPRCDQSITPSRIKNNLQAAEVLLTTEEMETVGKLNKGQRYCNPPWGITVFHDPDE